MRDLTINLRLPRKSSFNTKIWWVESGDIESTLVNYLFSTFFLIFYKKICIFVKIFFKNLATANFCLQTLRFVCNLKCQNATLFWPLVMAQKGSSNQKGLAPFCWKKICIPTSQTVNWVRPCKVMYSSAFFMKEPNFNKCRK